MHKFLLFFLISSSLVVAKEFVKPPSMALRTEVSFVSIMALNSIKPKDGDSWVLSFSLISNIHNESANNVTILVPRKLAQSLEPNINYVVAYYTHQKTKIRGQKKYIPNPNGAKLMEVDGAYPAIFRLNESVVNQLQIYPKHFKANPQKIINIIINGMFEKDQKVQEFFVMELMNWNELHQYLTKEDYAKLFQVFNSKTASINVVTAFLGSQSGFQKSMGIKKLGIKAINLLNNYPLELDPVSRNPSLIIQALNYVEEHGLGEWDMYDRWIQSNISSIVEKALLNLKKLDEKKTVELVTSRLLDTHINASSRRVFKRFMSSQTSQSKK